MAEEKPRELIELITSHAFHTLDEKQLQDELEKLFIANNISYEREVDLSPQDRIDFLVDSSIGIEVKVDSTWTQVSKQLQRYLKSDRLSCVILITTRSKHRSVPTLLAGKTVYHAMLLNRAF